MLGDGGEWAQEAWNSKLIQSAKGGAPSPSTLEGLSIHSLTMNIIDSAQLKIKISTSVSKDGYTFLKAMEITMYKVSSLEGKSFLLYHHIEISVVFRRVYFAEKL